MARESAAQQRIALVGHVVQVQCIPDGHRARAAVIEARGLSVAGGTNEIQRNIIAERVLGLPKDPGLDRHAPSHQVRVGTQAR